MGWVMLAELYLEHIKQRRIDLAVQLRHRHLRPPHSVEALALRLRLFFAQRELVEHLLQPRVLRRQLLLYIGAVLLHDTQLIVNLCKVLLGGLELRLDLLDLSSDRCHGRGMRRAGPRNATRRSGGHAKCAESGFCKG